MKIAVARETRAGEMRVAMVPELVGKLTGLGYDVAVEPGAGLHALISDEEYAAAGAVLEPGALDDADAVVSVQPLATDQIRRRQVVFFRKVDDAHSTAVAIAPRNTIRPPT